MGNRKLKGGEERFLPTVEMTGRGAKSRSLAPLGMTIGEREKRGRTEVRPYMEQKPPNPVSLCWLGLGGLKLPPQSWGVAHSSPARDGGCAFKLGPSPALLNPMLRFPFSRIGGGLGELYVNLLFASC